MAGITRAPAGRNVKRREATFTIEATTTLVPSTDAARSDQAGGFVYPAPNSELAWRCQVEFVDPDRHVPCPRCAKPCRWGCTITVVPHGPIRQSILHWPICACPDDHIRKAIVEALAAALMKELERRPPLEAAE